MRRDVFAIALVVLAIWLPRLFGLDRYVVSDEPLWLYRSANFYYALTHRDPASTYQKEHPGVTIMWAGTAGFLASYPGYRGTGLGQVQLRQFDYYIDRFAEKSNLDVLVAGRFFVVLGNVLALALSFLYARRLMGLLPALIGFGLIAFDPFHLALTRILHLDGLLGNLMLLSLIAFLAYSHDRRRVDLMISGAVAGFAWLTKSPGFLLVPAVGLWALVDVWRRLRSPNLGLKAYQTIWSCIWPILMWGLVGVIIFIAFWPAMWVDPIDALSAIIGKSNTYLEEGHSSPVFFNGKIVEDGQLGLGFIDFYPLTYLWRSTPVVLLGLILAAWGLVRRLKPFDRRDTRSLVYVLLLFVFVFSLMMTLGAKKSDRYLVPVFAPLDICAGLGWVSLAIWIRARWAAGYTRYATSLLLCFIVGTQMALSLNTFPYYASYYNPWMGGGSKAIEIMPIGWGEGLDQAARYLDQMSNAKDLHVISWYATGPFSYFFKGHTRFMGAESGDEDEDRNWERLVTADYAVVYVSQWQRNIPKKVLGHLSEQSPEYSVWINGIEYARVYKVR